MPVIREYQICGNCGKKQAGIQRWEVIEPPGEIHYSVECRNCKCKANYYPGSPFALWPWPGSEQAAADLLFSSEAKAMRASKRARAWREANDDAWSRVFTFAKELTSGKMVNEQATHDALTKAVKDIEGLQALGPDVFPPAEPDTDAASPKSDALERLGLA